MTCRSGLTFRCAAFSSPPKPATAYALTLWHIFMERVATRLKTLPTTLRLLVGLIGLGGLYFLIEIVRHLIVDPTTLLLLMTIVYSTMTFLLLGLGLFSIKTFELENNCIVEIILWGLIRIKTPIDEIENFKAQMTSNRIGTFEELILNRRNGGTIFIQEFDQRGFNELKHRLSSLLTLDKQIKPNYWTGFYKLLSIMLVIWYGLMIGIKIAA